MQIQLRNQVLLPRHRGAHAKGRYGGSASEHKRHSYMERKICVHADNHTFIIANSTYIRCLTTVCLLDVKSEVNRVVLDLN